MAITNHERITKAMELLKAGLAPFVERELVAAHGSDPLQAVLHLLGEERRGKKSWAELDAAALLKVMWEAWNEVFRKTLGPAERSLVSELRDARNRWAHQETFSSDDAYRTLDTVGRLLAAVSAPQSDELEKAKTELLRLRFDEQVRSEKRRSGIHKHDVSARAMFAAENRAHDSCVLGSVPASDIGESSARQSNRLRSHLERVDLATLGDQARHVDPVATDVPKTRRIMPAISLGGKVKSARGTDNVLFSSP